MKIQAAVLPAIAAPFELAELDLAPPRADEVLVRLHASGVCHSDQNAIDGTAPTPCPCVLGHEGAGIVEAIGGAVTRIAIGDHVALSWAPACGHCEQCLRNLPHLCGEAWPAMATGGLMDGTSRLSRDGETIHHYSFLSSFAEAAVVPEASCVPIPGDVPFPVAALVGCAVTTGVGAVWNTAGVRPGERVAVVGCGGVGLSAVMGAVVAGAAPIVAVDVERAKLDDALELGATDAVLWQGDADRTAAAVIEATGGGVDYAIEATGRPEAMRAAFLSTRTRGAAVLIGIPREDAEVRLPALSFPRMERRVLGALYGSSRPERDFGLILDQYRRGRLPLDRLISHRLPLAGVGEAFELLRAGAVRRAVLELA
jgi:Zn-dependent alcohol dehydrogenase